MKNQIISEVKQIKNELWDISDYIYHHPELGDNEFLAVEKLTGFLKAHSFKTEVGICNLATAFKAEYDSGKKGPTVAFLCEYDALPSIGHGCGHNMIGTMSAGAAVALSSVIEKTGGKIVVFGTPAEETNGAKVILSREGAFREVDAALILHPDGKTYESGPSLALEAIQIIFTGKSSHAAAAPEDGINALDGVIQTFNGINALRQHLTSDVRIHGIICDGGAAPAIVPDRAEAKFYVRARKKKYLQEVLEKVKNVVRGAAMVTGASVEILRYELPNDDMNTNEPLSEAFNENMKLAGITDINPPRKSLASIDMGNVSYVVPSIHPWLGIGDEELGLHTVEMAEHTISEKGHEALLKGAAALALTGYDVLTDKELLVRIKRDFVENV